MKKILAMLLVLSMVMAFAACADDAANTSSEASKATSDVVSADDSSADASSDASSDASADASSDASDDGVMTYDEFIAAEIGSEVCVETYIQASQGWWVDSETGDELTTLYCQSEDGAYFLYEIGCSEEDSKKIAAGAKIRVNGYKTEWQGEVEIIDGSIEFIEDAEPYIAEAFDATALLGTEELIAHQNEFVSFKGLTVKEISYKNDGGDDIYVTLTYNEADYSFCVEVYLTGTDSDVYTTVGTLKAGDVVDIEGFLYWYQGANTHITAISLAE